MSLLKNPGLRSQVDPTDYERLLFPQLKGLYVAVGARDRLRDLQFGPPSQFVAVNGVPSAHYLQKPTLGGSLGYIANIHFVADVDARFNVGKQTITNPRMIGQLNDFFNDCYRATLKNIAKQIVGRLPNELEDDDVEVTSYLELAAIPLPDMAFIKEPSQENGVIGLFFEMMGRGFINGYKFYGLTGGQKYDGRFRAAVLPNVLPKSPKSDKDLKTVEFKLRLRSLIDDFESERKDPREVDLAIVWEDDLPAGGTLSYQKLNMEESNFADRHYHRVNTVLHDTDSGAAFQVIVLSKTVEEISQEALVGRAKTQ